MMNSSDDYAISQQPAWPMFRALVGVGVVCALLVALVFQYSAPVIERNRVAALERAVLKVLPNAVNKQAYRLVESSFVEQVGADLVYAGYSATGEWVGLAVKAMGLGYQDNIRLLYGYDANAQEIVGLTILESKETPGLGDKIEFYPRFVANFEHLEVKLNAQGNALLNPIVAVKETEKTQPWQIDGITGATVSSKAVARILQQSASVWLPQLYRYRDEFDPRQQVKANKPIDQSKTPFFVKQGSSND